MSYVDFLEFYTKNGKDDHDRTLDEILSYSDDQLERSHNIIQRLFPLNEPSMHDWTAPLAGMQDFEELANDQKAKENILRAVLRFMKFYGIDLVKQTFDDDKVMEWVSPKNHNYKRLTRMLHFLNSVEMKGLADQIYEMLIKISESYYYRIGYETIEYWHQAAGKNYKNQE